MADLQLVRRLHNHSTSSAARGTLWEPVRGRPVVPSAPGATVCAVCGLCHAAPSTPTASAYFMSPAAVPGSGLESLHRATLVVLTVVLTLLMMVMRIAMA